MPAPVPRGCCARRARRCLPASAWRRPSARLPCSSIRTAGPCSRCPPACAGRARVAASGHGRRRCCWRLSPICGHRPTTGPFVAFVALTARAVPGWLARLCTRDRAAALELLGTPIGLALTGYVGASVLSLSSLPLYAPGRHRRRRHRGRSDPPAAGRPRRRRRDRPGYRVLTVVLTLHAAVAALTVAVAVRAEAGAQRAGGADAALSR